jgi:translocation and assembly module TamA
MHPPRNLARLRRVGLMMGTALALLTAPQDSRAANPQPYSVAIAPTADDTLNKALTDASSLVSLRESAPVGPFPLLARARGDVERLQKVLHGLGYYAAQVDVSIAGRPLDDPTLLTTLDDTTGTVAVKIAVTPGPLFHLRHISLTGDVPSDPQAKRELEAKLGLEPGAPAVASEVLAAGARVLTALRDSGHALAKVDSPIATLDPAAKVLDVSFAVHAGPQVDLGPISVSGLARLNESYLRRRMNLHAGERYSPAVIARARGDLAATGLFTTIRVEPASKLDASGRLPVAVVVKERKLRTVNLGASFSTDEGGSLNAGWTHRNLFGNAEKLTISGAVTQLGGSANRQPGYNLGATLVLPDWHRRDQSLTFNILALREYLDAYDRTGLLGGAVLARKLDPHLTASVGLTGMVEEVSQEGMRDTYRLAQVPLKLVYDSTTSVLDPTSGSRASVSLTPTFSLGNGTSSTFLISQASGSTYLDFNTKGRSVLALRALVGAVQGAGVFGIPPDQRFYAGGSSTIRGFRYQSLGGRFASGRPIGGDAIDVGSVEFRQRIGTSWGAAAFLDAGQINGDGVPFSGGLKVGAGAGVRYYTSIGPVRVDVAVPLTREKKADAFVLYIGLGQAF